MMMVLSLFLAAVALIEVHAKQEAVLSSSGEVSFSGEDSPVHFIQQKSRMDKGQDESLPKVSSVLTKENAIFDKMTSHISALEDNLGAFQRKSTKEIAKKKAAFESNLTAQHAMNRAIRRLNNNLSTDIAALEVSNTKLRKLADEYLTANHHLVARLRSLQGNMSLAQEFVSIVLNRSSELLETAPELQVMQDLAKEDEERRRKAAFKHAFDQVGKGKHLAAVQVEASIHGHGHGNGDVAQDDAQGLLDTMSGALTELQEQQQASEAALVEEFEKEYQNVMEARVQLLSEQAELNGTKAHALELEANLTDAVNHLHQTNRFLHKQMEAMHSFSSRLGTEASTHKVKSDHKGKGLSLLQTSSDKDQESLPGMKKLTRKPSAVMDSVNTQVTQLLDRLEKAHQHNSDISSKQKKEFDRQLLELNNNISFQQQENAKAQEDIDGLDENITALRLRAEEMVKNNKKLREDLKLIQANMSIAQEYLEELLNDTHEPLAHTKDLKVLHELAQEDAAESAQLAHEEQLKEVSMVALLQVQGGEDKQSDHSVFARDIFSSLNSSMDTLEEEHKASQAKLLEAFEKEFHGLNKTYHKLVHHWGKLNATRTEKTEVQQKLQVAVEHLDHTGQVLTKRRTALLSFAGKLADLPPPVEQTTTSDANGNTSNRLAGMINFQKAYDVLTGFFSRNSALKSQDSPQNSLA